MKFGCSQRRALLALACAAVAAAAPVQAVEVGQVAPGFELAAEGRTLNLDQYRGQTVYLDFWASWCGPCKQSFPWMNALQSRLGPKGLRVLAVNVDQKTADAKAFLQEHPAQFDVAFDASGKVPKAYAIKGMPTSVLIGPDGKVLMVHSGFRDEQRAELEGRIQQALSTGSKP